MRAKPRNSPVRQMFPDSGMPIMPPTWNLTKRMWPSLLLIALVTAAAVIWLVRPQPTQAAPELTVYASPINAGCYLATKSTCKIRVDPFTIASSGTPALFGFQLRANGSVIYDFRTDVSNPPFGNYSPSRVKLDFAASCGKTYVINLVARDLDDPAFYNLGQVVNVVCPQGTYETFLPMIKR